MKWALIVGWLFLAGSSLLCDDYADLFRQAASHSQNGQYEEAMAEYKAALAIRPGAPEAVNNVAVMCYQLHHYSDAFEYATKIWASHPELKSAALVAGMAAVQCNRPKEAIAPLQAAIARDASSRDAVLTLGSAYYALNNFPDAIRTYKQEVDHSPSDFMAWYGLAICYERSAENSSAKLARMPGGRAYSKLMLAQYLQGGGDGKLAAEAFGDASETGSAAASTEAEQEYKSARTLAAKSQEAFERVVSLAPKSWQTLIFLGDVARQRGDLVDAFGHYRNALAKQPDNPAPLLGLGTVYWEMGNFDQATSFLHQTLEKN
ncbi:MAG: tetratricopeptide repeat protein, partial [Acidobacteriota bacterium]|nr:tetratricopeptide repeat protein [Acidobacteriota bacterium]